MNLVHVHAYFNNKLFTIMFKLRKRQIPKLVKSFNYTFVKIIQLSPFSVQTTILNTKKKVNVHMNSKLKGETSSAN